MSVSLIHGDCLVEMAKLDAGSVHCVVTSPPFWGLRSYLPQDHPDKVKELGSEKTPEEYVAKLVEAFRAIRRILRGDGTCWLNLGDSYTSGGHSAYASGEAAGKQAANDGWANTPRPALPLGLKPLDLVGIPWRVAFALQQDGWYLRSDVIWAKPNPMPESLAGWRWEQCRVKIAKSKHAEKWNIKGGEKSMLESNGQSGHGMSEDWRAQWADCPGCPKCQPNGGLVLRRGSWRPTKSYEHIFLLAKSEGYFADGEAVKEESEASEASLKRAQYGRYDAGDGTAKRNSRTGKPDYLQAKGNDYGGGIRNCRDVWTFATQSFPGAHFATYPEELVRRCIAAGTSERGVCPKCGAPYARVVDREAMIIDRSERTHEMGRTRASGTMVKPPRCGTLGWRATCSCNAGELVGATVCDPFLGSGTTALVAIRMGRRAIGIDLSADYLAIARKRIDDEVGLLALKED